MNGTSTRNVRVEEIVIAVAPAEVAPLDEAKALKHKLTCVARSGLPASAPAPAVQRPAGGTAQGGMSQVLAAPGKALLGKAERGRPGQGFAAARTSENRQPHEGRNARQGSGGIGHHARLEPHGRRPFHGSDDWNETAIHALQRTGEQPRRDSRKTTDRPRPLAGGQEPRRLPLRKRASNRRCA